MLGAVPCLCYPAVRSVTRSRSSVPVLPGGCTEVLPAHHMRMDKRGYVVAYLDLLQSFAGQQYVVSLLSRRGMGAESGS
jgi:hypothetical protein